MVKRVGVQELDQRFSDVAEIFNKQHEHYETMVRRIRNVRQIYGCNSNDTLALTECMMKIRDEHGEIDCKITLAVPCKARITAFWVCLLSFFPV